MSLNVAYTEADVCNFVEALRQINRRSGQSGQTPSLSVCGGAVVLAILK